MASGLLCHSASDRPQWQSDLGYRLITAPTRFSAHSTPQSMPTQSPEHDAWGGHASPRTRLPSFSNFLSAAGQAGLSPPTGPASSTFHASPPSAYVGGYVSHEHDRYRRQTPPQPNTLSHIPQDAFIKSVGHEGLPHLAPVNDANGESRDAHPVTNGSLFTSPNYSAAPIHLRPFGSPTSPEPGQTRVVVREEIIPGKGLCYVYDDGSVCQKTINGDPVNPKWGTTKAGKPRKRLGQACNTCREKKIKCDPSVPKCVQCQKFGRECKFETTPRSSHRSLGGASAVTSPGSDVNRDRYLERSGSNASLELPQEHVYNRVDSRSSMNLESLLSSSTEPSENADSRRPSKKPRFSTGSIDESATRPTDLAPEGVSDLAQAPPQSQLEGVFSIASDPYDIDEYLTTYYLGKYFSHINAAAYCMFPKRLFMRWVREDKNKSRSDITLLYAMMALGAVFSKKRECVAHQQCFSDIAHDAVAESSGVLELQVVQTRLILSLLNFSANHLTAAWEQCSSAVRTACDMRMNVEDEKMRVLEKRSPCFGFDASTYVECRRRTFWAAYIMDCFYGCCSGYASAMSKPDCLLRLPCSDAMYEDGEIPEMPYFDPKDFESGSQNCLDPSMFGLMAYLVQIGTIFGHISTQINRTRYMEADRYNTAQETFHHDTMGQLQAWDRALRRQLDPESLHLKPQTSDKPVEKETGLHVFFHYAVMILCRHVRFEHMSQQARVRNCKKAYAHALKVLELTRKASSQEAKDVLEPKMATMSPLTGHVIFMAIDIVTAANTMSNVLDSRSEQNMMGLVWAGIEALEKHTEHWETGHDQLDRVKARVGTLLTASESEASSRKTAFFVREPLHQSFERDEDIVYGLPRLDYLQALGSADVRDEAHVHEIGAVQTPAAGKN